MKILIPVLGFGSSGGYRVLSNLANELIDLGNDVMFICPLGFKKPYFPTKAKILWADKYGILSPIEKTEITTPKAAAIQRSLISAFSKIPEDSYDIIFANQSLTTLPIWIKRLSKKTVYYVQAYEPDYYEIMGGIKNKITSVFSSMSYKFNLFTIVNSPIYQNYKNLKSSRILYPGIDFDIFHPSEKEKRKTNKIILGTIGRIEKYKGTFQIIEAFKIIHQQFPNTELHIAYGKAENFPHTKGIKFLSPTNDFELAEFYRSLDLYVCAGYTQLGGFHYPVAEAMTCGTPVVTTHYYPATENNSWLITKPKELQNLLDQMKLAIENPEMGYQKSIEALKDTQQFDWKKVGKKLEEYLHEFLASKN